MGIQEFKITRDVLATQSDRLINYVIDFIVQFAIAMAVGFLASVLSDLFGGFALAEWLAAMDKFEEYMFGIVITLFYYGFCEISFSRTLGKLVTKTIVVKEDGSKPDAAVIIKRTFCRLIPFDGLSYLGAGGARGWHDTIPRVYVVKKKAFKESMDLFYAFDEIGIPE